MVKTAFPWFIVIFRKHPVLCAIIELQNHAWKDMIDITMFWSWDTVGNLLDFPKKRFMEKMELSKRKVVNVCRQYIGISFRLAHTACQSSNSIHALHLKLWKIRFRLWKLFPYFWPLLCNFLVGVSRVTCHYDWLVVYETSGIWNLKGASFSKHWSEKWTTAP